MLRVLYDIGATLAMLCALVAALLSNIYFTIVFTGIMIVCAMNFIMYKK